MKSAARSFNLAEHRVILSCIRPVGGRIPGAIEQVHVPLAKAQQIAHHISGIVFRGNVQQRLVHCCLPAQKSQAVFLYKQFYRIQIPKCGGVCARRPAVFGFRKQVSARVYQERYLFRVLLHNCKKQRRSSIHIHRSPIVTDRLAVLVRTLINRIWKIVKRSLEIMSRSVYHRVKHRRI